MRVILSILLLVSTSIFAQKGIQRVDVPFGEKTIEVERVRQKLKRHVVKFQWEEVRTITENYCVSHFTSYRPIYCSSGRQIFICGEVPVLRCLRYATRTYDVKNKKVEKVKIKYGKSAREDFYGPERFEVNFNKEQMCSELIPLNANANARKIVQKSCSSFEIE